MKFDLRAIYENTRQEGECRIWLGSLDRDGYGRIFPENSKSSKRVHRVAFALLHGSIKPGHDVDHTCFNRACISENHLAGLPERVNRARQRAALAGACHLGHPFDPDNTYTNPGGFRVCRACNVLRSQKYRIRRAA